MKRKITFLLLIVSLNSFLKADFDQFDQEGSIGLDYASYQQDKNEHDAWYNSLSDQEKALYFFKAYADSFRNFDRNIAKAVEFLKTDKFAREISLSDFFDRYLNELFKDDRFDPILGYQMPLYGDFCIYQKIDCSLDDMRSLRKAENGKDLLVGWWKQIGKPKTFRSNKDFEYKIPFTHVTHGWGFNHANFYLERAFIFYVFYRIFVLER